jgi:hypothetical protein
MNIFQGIIIHLGGPSHLYLARDLLLNLLHILKTIQIHNTCKTIELLVLETLHEPLVPKIVHEHIDLEAFFQPIDLKNVLLFDSKFDHPS